MGVVSRAAGPRRPPSPRRLARRKRWPLLVPVALVGALGVVRFLDNDPATAAVTATASSAPAVPTSTLVSFTSPAGERTTAARCWMIMIDESSSMSTADAPGTRADAVRAAHEFLGTYGLADDRIGVTWFADVAAAEPPRAAAAGGRAATPPRDLGSGTMISSALTATLDAMDRTCGATQRVVVLVSDGQATSDAEFEAVAATITGRARDVRFHLVAMNGGGAFEPSRPFWEGATLGLTSVRTVETFERDEVSAAIAAILTIETGQEVEPR